MARGSATGTIAALAIRCDVTFGGRTALVRFTIEVYSTDADKADKVFHRTSVTTINPAGARKEAIRLLAAWEKRNAKGVRVINDARELIYHWKAAP
jgi:hypothetical protein